MNEGGLNAVWTGSEVGVVWCQENWSTDLLSCDVELSWVGDDGSYVSEDILIGPRSCYSNWIPVLWTGSSYGIFWDDGNIDSSVHGVRLSHVVPPDPDVETSRVMIVDDTYQTYMSAAWTGSNYGLLWARHNRMDMSDSELFIQRVSPSGDLIGSAVKIPNLAPPGRLHLVWSGYEYGVCWSEQTEEGGESRVRVYFNRVGFCED